MIRSNWSQPLNSINKVCSTSFESVNKLLVRKIVRFRETANDSTTGLLASDEDNLAHNVTVIFTD